MNGLFHHPAVPTLLMCILSLYPLFKIYKRVGLSGFWSFLIFMSLFIPFSGFALVLLPITIKAWPNFPKPAEKPKPVKLEI